MKFAFLIAFCLFGCEHTTDGNTITEIKIHGRSANEKIKSIAATAKKFCSGNGFNNKIFLLADMSLHSGKKRFFVYNMNADSVIAASMVAHGACGYSFLQNARFSNEPGCGCSSIGKYKIGNKYTGRFGTAYKLFGLDSSNSNAFERAIVLHGYYDVPDNETYPEAICNSLGCPMVSLNFLKQLEMKIDKSSKPVLLWIVN